MIEEDYPIITLKIKYKLTKENLSLFEELGNKIISNDNEYLKFPFWIKKANGSNYYELLDNDEATKEVGDIIKGMH